MCKSSKPIFGLLNMGICVTSGGTEVEFSHQRGSGIRVLPLTMSWGTG